MTEDEIEQKYKDNVYYKRNPEMFMWLMSYIQRYSANVCCKVISRKYSLRHIPHNADIEHLVKWIVKMTTQFDFDIEIQTRIYCITHNVVSLEQFPHCKTCNKPIVQNVETFAKGFQQLQFCSIKCRANNEEFKAKIREQRMSKYGGMFGDPKKVIETRIARHGRKNSKLSQSLKRAYQKNKAEIQLKKQATLLKNYGVTSPMLSSELRSRQNRRIMYNEKKFDSMAELSFYIWLIENKIQFEFQPNHMFLYSYAGKDHMYFPDFKIGDMFFEIKGDQFFKEDGTMQNPFDHSQDGLYEAKHQCMLANDVIILKSSEYQMFELYVAQKYGCNYLKQFKMAKKKDIAQLNVNNGCNEERSQRQQT